VRKLKKDEIDKRVHHAASILGLEDLLKRKPRALSGGQRQRVAMGRAIVREPAAFLMDEPLSNLDAKLRVATRAELSTLTDELGVTTIYVTHDQVEALTMGDRVAVMRKGELQQVAPPQELYDHPVNLFVGGFIGSPAMNMFEATLESESDGHELVAGSQRLALDDDTLSARPALRAYEGRKVIVGLRPEALEDAALAGDSPDGKRLRGKVELVEALGSELVVHFEVDARPALTEDVQELVRDVGGELEETEHSTLVGRFDPRSKVSAGDTVEAVVEPGAFHFFDPDTGAGIYDAPQDATKGASQ
jgi:multiple sugar transport system ATP-binding protein